MPPPTDTHRSKDVHLSTYWFLGQDANGDLTATPQIWGRIRHAFNGDGELFYFNKSVMIDDATDSLYGYSVNYIYDRGRISGVSIMMAIERRRFLFINIHKRLISIV